MRRRGGGTKRGSLDFDRDRGEKVGNLIHKVETQKKTEVTWESKYAGLWPLKQRVSQKIEHQSVHLRECAREKRKICEGRGEQGRGLGLG